MSFPSYPEVGFFDLSQRCTKNVFSMFIMYHSRRPDHNLLFKQKSLKLLFDQNFWAVTLSLEKPLWYCTCFDQIRLCNWSLIKNRSCFVLNVRNNEMADTLFQLFAWNSLKCFVRESSFSLVIYLKAVVHVNDLCSLDKIKCNE
jgi:hypothetical protein